MCIADCGIGGEAARGLGGRWDAQGAGWAGRRSAVWSVMSGSGSGSLPHLGVLLLAAVLLQTVAVTVTVLYFSNTLSSMRETFARSSVSCFTRGDPPPVRARGESRGETRGDPCWQVTQQLHSLIEKSMSQRYQSQISSAVRDEVSRVLPSLVVDDRSPHRPKVAAHVTGSFVPPMDSDGGAPGRRVHGQKISWWEGRKGLAFLQDVQLQDGELMVPRPGLYYVYAQTYFRHTHPMEDQDREEPEVEGGRELGKPLLQYVYKKMNSYADPILLMKTSRTSCWSRGSQFSLHSAHQGGLVPLSAGDRLFVTVSNASAVDMDEKSSFFGAFLVS
ncbi:hypothetical protein CRUP_028782 [Coryphaenoides rupestris]|nr:hypothetical protein CRUP_028782 [Coryphaenoides rupestris]